MTIDITQTAPFNTFYPHTLQWASINQNKFHVIMHKTLCVSFLRFNTSPFIFVNFIIVFTPSAGWWHLLVEHETIWNFQRSEHKASHHFFVKVGDCCLEKVFFAVIFLLWNEFLICPLIKSRFYDFNWFLKTNLFQWNLTTSFKSNSVSFEVSLWLEFWQVFRT